VDITEPPVSGLIGDFTVCRPHVAPQHGKEDFKPEVTAQIDNLLA
jgi:hypothetical protein